MSIDTVDRPRGRFGAQIDPARYRRHVEILAGERATADGRWFVDRFLPSATHQLNEVAAWLADYYRALGLEARLEPVVWNGRDFANVIVELPGRSREAIVLCDHYDVADKEELRPRARAQVQRFSPELRRRAGAIAVGAPVPGADDNASATAALMEMGALLAKQRPSGASPDLVGGARKGPVFEKTIVIAHLVGEELPADCLGARTFLAHAQEEGRPIAAAIVLDMIGVDRSGRRKMQISPGRGARALALASEVKRAVAELELDLVPVLRPYGARKSFLHQTDGIHFSRAGIPVVLLNEHVNDDFNLHRAGYHDEFDTTALMSFDFAADITRAALETTYRLAGD